MVASNRPRDVSFAIDQMLARSGDPADLLAGALDGPASLWRATRSAASRRSPWLGGHDGLAPDERVAAIIPIAAASVR